MKVLVNILIILLVIMFGSCQPGVNQNITQYDFINPPTAVKIHTWWHWIDGVHTNDEITKVMKLNRDKAYLRKLILPVSPYI